MTDEQAMEVWNKAVHTNRNTPDEPNPGETGASVIREAFEVHTKELRAEIEWHKEATLLADERGAALLEEVATLTAKLADACAKVSAQQAAIVEAVELAEQMNFNGYDGTCVVISRTLRPHLPANEGGVALPRTVKALPDRFRSFR